jgi:hypothetical protein
MCQVLVQLVGLVPARFVLSVWPQLSLKEAIFYKETYITHCLFTSYFTRFIHLIERDSAFPTVICSGTFSSGSSRGPLGWRY